MDGTEAEPLLAERLTGDTSEDVRAAAATIAGARAASPVLVDALTKVSTHDADRQVRYDAVTTLARWLKDRPEIRALLEEIANAEHEPKIREVARRALGDGTKPPI